MMDLSDIFSGAFSPSKWRALGEHLANTGIITGPGLRTKKIGGKTIITAPNRNRQTVFNFPFQVTASPVLLEAAPGIIGSTTVNSDTDLKVTNPAGGNHYLIWKVTINATTGAKTLEKVYWSSTVPTDTTTDFYGALAYVEITSGEITTAEQYNYGPIMVLVGAGATDIWKVETF